MVILESKSGKYSFEAEVELERLLTADPAKKYRDVMLVYTLLFISLKIRASA